MTDLVAGPVTVRVSATSANLGPGFDSFGLCLDLADVVTAEATGAGTEIVVCGEGVGELPEDDSHLVVTATRAAFDAWGVGQPGLRVVCRNAVPQGRGLGSSAAAIVAGLLLARALVPDHHVGDTDLLSLAAVLDGHADNVAACLLGGLVVAWVDGGGPAVVRLEVHPDVVPVVFCSARPMSTTVARGVLPDRVSHADAAANAARAALLVVAMTCRPDLLLPATVDRLHQEARRSAEPESMRLVDALREAEVPAVVSGSGPSVLALCTDEQASRVGPYAPKGWRLLRMAVDPQGARVLARRPDSE